MDQTGDEKPNDNGHDVRIVVLCGVHRFRRHHPIARKTICGSLSFANRSGDKTITEHFGRFLNRLAIVAMVEMTFESNHINNN